MEIILASVMASWQLPESVDSLKTMCHRFSCLNKKSNTGIKCVSNNLLNDHQFIILQEFLA